MAKDQASDHAAPWTTQVPGQPEGTQDRTPPPREAFPRDVDEGDGRHVVTEPGSPVDRAERTGPDGSVVKPGATRSQP
mgnify:FL=1